MAFKWKCCFPTNEFTSKDDTRTSQSNDILNFHVQLGTFGIYRSCRVHAMTQYHLCERTIIHWSDAVSKIFPTSVKKQEKHEKNGRFEFLFFSFNNLCVGQFDLYFVRPQTTPSFKPHSIGTKIHCQSTNLVVLPIYISSHAGFSPSERVAQSVQSISWLSRKWAWPCARSRRTTWPTSATNGPPWESCPFSDFEGISLYVYLFLFIFHETQRLQFRFASGGGCEILWPRAKVFLLCLKKDHVFYAFHSDSCLKFSTNQFRTNSKFLSHNHFSVLLDGC